MMSRRLFARTVRFPSTILSVLSIAGALVIVGLMVLSRDAYSQPRKDADLWELSYRVDSDQAAGHYDEAMERSNQGLLLSRQRFGNQSAWVGFWLNQIGALLLAKGKFEEAVSELKDSLVIREQVLGPNHSHVAVTLSNLGVALNDIGQAKEAEGVLKRAINIFTAQDGPDSLAVAKTKGCLASLYQSGGLFSDAAELYKSALATYERELGNSDIEVATMLSNLGSLYLDLKDYHAAEPLFRRALDIIQKVRGADHPESAFAIENLAKVFDGEGRPEEALPLFTKAVRLEEKLLGDDHPYVAATHGSLADMFARKHDWVSAYDHIKRAASIYIREAEHLSDEDADRLSRRKGYFQAFVKFAERARGSEFAQSLNADTFLMAQWAEQTAAAVAISKMGARLVASTTDLAEVVRTKQNQEKKLAELNSFLLHSASKGEGGLGATRIEIDAVKASLDVSLRRLKSEYPDYETVVRPLPLTLSEAREYLQDDEVLVQFLSTPDDSGLPAETFVWVVSRHAEPRWYLTKIEALEIKSLDDAVASLRCGLDSGGWEDSSSWPEGTLELKRKKVFQLVQRAKCKALTRSVAESSDSATKLLPFDLKLAHALYESLFGQFEDVFRNKHLLIVPSGSLTSLPLGVMVTKSAACTKNREDCYRGAAWLGTDDLVKSITILPAISTLKTLRRGGRGQSKATKPYIGFANPSLSGGGGQLSTEAASWQHCSDVDFKACAGRFPGTISGSSARNISLLDWSPLPQTACEVCAIARQLKVPETELDRVVLLGNRLRKSTIVRLGALTPGESRAELQNYKVVHFATHGALADPSWQFNEPGLILTPPPEQESSEQDNGYLGASEIAQLHLDADLVILSACNTAGGDGHSLQALSGLASSFFYAGARSVLVSHWEMSTNAAVDLTTRAMKLTATKGIGNAEAFHQATRELFDEAKRSDDEAVRRARLHPSFWGAFSLVGGGRANP